MAYSSRIAYMGFTKQVTFNTPLAPTIFPRWLDGSMLEPDAKFSEIFEGDGGRDYSLVFKDSQMWKGKLICYPRPTELGWILQMVNGVSSDTLTAGNAATTSAAIAAAGATTVSCTASIASGQKIQIDSGTAAEWRVTTGVSGGGPYAVTFAGGLSFAHASGIAVTPLSSHAFAPKDTPSYYTFEMGFNQTALVSAGSPILRVGDCVITQVDFEAEPNKPIKVTVDFVGRVAVRQASAASVTLEAGAPMKMTTGVFQIDDSTGLVLADRSTDISKIKVTWANGIDDTLYTSAITPNDFIWTTRKVNTEYELIFVDDSKFRQMYLGGASGTTDSSKNGVGTASFQFFQEGDIRSNALTILLNSMVYQGKPVQMKLDGKGLRQQHAALVVKPTTGNLVDMTLLSPRITAY